METFSVPLFNNKKKKNLLLYKGMKLISQLKIS